MMVECGMEFFETLRRHSLAEEFLAAGVADDINDDAAERRSGGGHEHIQKKAGAVLVDVTGDYRIHGQPDETAVESGHGQHTPCPQRLEQRPQKGGIASEDVFDGFQDLNLEVYVNVGIGSATKDLTTEDTEVHRDSTELLVLRISAQQLQSMRQQFDYRFQRLHRSRRASWKVQNHRLPPHAADGPAKRGQWGLLRAFRTHALGHAFEQTLADGVSGLRSHIPLSYAGPACGHDQPRPIRC